MALTAVALAAATACGNGGTGTSTAAKEMCKVDADARVCLTPVQASSSYHMVATGFRPNSDMTIVLTGPKVATTVAGTPSPPLARVDAQGKFPPSNGTSGVVIPRGSGMVTVMVTGTASGGQAVTFSLTVDN